ncbi:MAG TPA: hypothetical protein VEZ17_11180, partial [Chitinophagaceae bacterium]|nr:hypothetical protein [Chitinophagaceae bacterium]
ELSSEGSRTHIRITEVKAGNFSGNLDITLFNGSPLINVAAVLATSQDSTAIVYDAGLVSSVPAWKNLAWSDTLGSMQHKPVGAGDSATNLAVRYRTIIGQNPEGSLALFPAPHQYFYPLDEAFNLRFTWYGNNYRSLLTGFGMGIRQELEGDKRFVPWFNAPPGTQQRLNFFCLLGSTKPEQMMEDVKLFTHRDSYVPLKGYKTMASHFHNEFVMKVALADKPVPENPAFIDVFKTAGVNIVHLAEFHYTAHPKGPDEQRLLELKTLFDLCKRSSSAGFLLLPGEEPNEFFGGHWLQFFPKPVYWIMSRKADMPFVQEDSTYGKIYRVADKKEMLTLLESEQGLAWTAHPRTKGSTGFPDKYKEESFFKSPRFMGAAWKAMPADLSQPRLGKRVLDLMDDMNNWGLKKKVIGEADLFTIEHGNEMYAHMNVNYLQLDTIPAYERGWKPILDVLEDGRFFTTTGEVLIPSFSVNGKGTGETAVLKDGRAELNFNVNWTFPLQFAEIISGDGKEVFRQRVDLSNTRAFGEQTFHISGYFRNRTWIRLEVWDAAVNGAYTQTVWLK